MPRIASVLLAAVLALWIGYAPLAGQIPPADGQAAYAADLAQRRARLMASLGPDTILVVWSAPKRTYSADIDYPYRQDSNLLYLTGLLDDATTLVLVPGARTTREILFVREPDETRALWYGRVMTPREITDASGVRTVYAVRDDRAFRSFIEALLGGIADGRLPPNAATEFSDLFDAIRSGRAKLSIADPVPDDGAPAAPDAEPHLAWARRMVSAYPGVALVSANQTLKRQRQIKTAYEQRVLTKSAALSAAAHVAGMRLTRPGVWEYELKAAVEYTFLKGGALSWGYPSIVGSGPNSTSLHYLAGTRELRSGDIVLVDAAGSYQGLTADITRSYPVSGRFSDQQRAVYDLVFAAQEAGIAAARPGVPVTEVTSAVRRVFAAGLVRLGLVRATSGPDLEAQIDLWFPHLPVHGIGVDVHDALDVLEPGSAFVIEPGLYIRPDAFERLAKTPANAELARALAPAVAAYRDIGIRIEDSFVMTTAGPRMLSSDAPRRPQDIEKIVGRAR